MSGAESIYQSAPQGPTLVGSGVGVGVGVGVTCGGKNTSSVVPPRTSSYHSVPTIVNPNAPPAAAAAPAMKVSAGIATARATGGTSANEFATRVDRVGGKGEGGAAREADSEEEREKEEHKETQRGYEGLGHTDARAAAAQRGSSAGRDRVGLGSRGGALKPSDLREPSDGLIVTKGNSTLVSSAEGGGGGTDAKDLRKARGLRRASSSSSSTEKGQDPSRSSSSSTTSATASITQYVKKHKIHLLLDGLVKDLLSEKPDDANRWMLRWFLEKHRSACEERHIRNSPQSLQKMNGRKSVINADSDDAADENHSSSGNRYSKPTQPSALSLSEPEQFSYERKNVSSTPKTLTMRDSGSELRYSTPTTKEKGGANGVVLASISSPTLTIGAKVTNDEKVGSSVVTAQSLQRSTRPPPPRLPIGIFVQSEGGGENGSNHEGEQQFLSVSAQSKASPNGVRNAGAKRNPFSSSSSSPSFVREEQEDGTTRYTTSTSLSTHQQEHHRSGTGSGTATTTTASVASHGVTLRLRDTDTDGFQGQETSLSSAIKMVSSSLPPPSEEERNDESNRPQVGTTCPSASSSPANGQQHSSGIVSKNGKTIPITTTTIRRESHTNQQDKEQSRRVPEGNLRPELHSPTSSCGEEESAASSSLSPSASVAAVAEAVVALTVEEAVSGSNNGSAATTPVITPSSTRSPPEIKANSQGEHHHHQQQAGCSSPPIIEKKTSLKTINKSKTKQNGINNVDKEIDGAAEEEGAEPLSDPLFVSSPELTTEANEVDQQLMSAVLIHKAAQLKESTSPQEEQRRMEDLKNKLRGGGGGTGGGVSLLASLSPSSALLAKRGAQDGEATDKTNRRLDMAHTDL